MHSGYVVTFKKLGLAAASELEKKVQPIIKKARQQKQTPEVVAPGLNDEQIWRLFERYIAKKTKGRGGGEPDQLVGCEGGMDLLVRCIYNLIHPPSELAPESELYCFRSFIISKWEEPNGGKWTLTFAKGNSDNSWKHTLQTLMKEQFDHGDDVCGAAVSITDTQEEISLWTKNAANEAVQLSIGKQWKAILDCNETIGFIIHEDARQLGRRAKIIYEV
ncbi:hypothetical protein M0R45_013517 [Rubus argutus]|uniref:Eukaryotic translation initiation factor 4E-1 n=1 Tax=Rubus argutus TaxID=59490 RepID=A0AAW1XKS2_RUBAR